MNNDLKIFEKCFIYDIPGDVFGFFMYGKTGKTFYFTNKESMIEELQKAASYALNHGVKFDPTEVYKELMKV